MRDFPQRLLDRAALSGVTVPAALIAPLTVYVDVLEHWNEKINLTSFDDPDEAIDRLLLEPIAAAAHLPPQGHLIDLGSGGGSPALPLALALGVTRLVMVESRERKASFLREVVRQLELSDIASVETNRFETLAERDDFRASFTAVSVRAVRIDTKLLTAALGFLRPHGLIASFRGLQGADRLPSPPADLVLLKTVPLLTHSSVQLALFARPGSS